MNLHLEFLNIFRAKSLSKHVYQEHSISIKTFDIRDGQIPVVGKSGASMDSENKTSHPRREEDVEQGHTCDCGWGV